MCSLTDALYTYATDDKGVYTLTVAGAFDVYGDNNAMGAGYGRMDGKTTGLFAHKAKTAYLDQQRHHGDWLSTCLSPPSLSARALMVLGSPSLATLRCPH